MNNRLYLCLFSALLLSGCAVVEQNVVSDGSSLEKVTPKSGSPFLTLRAKGVQYFRCNTDAKGGFWQFERPEAVLTDASGQKVGELSGPMQAFEHQDGSRIISSHLIAWTYPKNPQKDNKLALFEAVSDPGEKTFDDVKYVQRLDTVGGMPQGSCSPQEKGRLLKVPFSAKFVFWK